MHLKTALSNIRRSPFQALTAIFALSVTFFIASIIGVLIYASAQVLNYFETRPQVIVFLKQDAKEIDINSLRSKLEKDDRIKDLKFVSKEEALSIYKNVTSNNPLLGQLVSPSIFPASIEFSLKDLKNAQKIIDEFKKEQVVDSIGFTASLGNEDALKEVIDRLTKITYYIRVGGLSLALVLAFTSFLVLMVVISMRISSKRNEIETLRLIGATSSFIRLPILMEGIVYVTLAVLIGWILSLIFMLYISPTIINYFGSVPVLPRAGLDFLKLNLVVLGIELLVGFVIAIVGSWAAVTRAISK